MSSTNCPKHNCELVGFGTYTFCPQCDGEESKSKTVPWGPTFYMVHTQQLNQEAVIAAGTHVFDDLDKARKDVDLCIAYASGHDRKWYIYSLPAASFTIDQVASNNNPNALGELSCVLVGVEVKLEETRP